MQTNIRLDAVPWHCCFGICVAVSLCLLQAAGAVDPSAADQAKLSSLQQKIDELDRAGKYKEAIPIAEEHLKLVESTIGTDRPETGAACDKLGDLYRKNGEYAKAETILQRGLKIREKALGREHPDTAKSLYSLAVL